MASRSIRKPAANLLGRGFASSNHNVRNFSNAACLAQQQQASTQAGQNDATTHFGFEEVPRATKQGRVSSVFSSVASSYDTMNDLMSLSIHRLWKDHFVRSLNPGCPPSSLAFTTSSSSSSSSSGTSQSSSPQRILDMAGGTGDIAFRLLEHATLINNDHTCTVTVADINTSMLAEGQKRSLTTLDPSHPASGNNPRLKWLEANAESLPQDAISSNSLDLYTIAFGIRNVPDQPAALREAFRVLKPGGVFACLEFGKVANPLLDAVYKRWSFGAIPLIGQLVAGDRDSYQYLVESIERFPEQRVFMEMIREAGFVIPGLDEGEGKGWEDLTGGIAAIHKGVKPLR